MPNRKAPKPRGLSAAQKNARKLAAERMKALNAARRTEANVIANSAKRAAGRAATKLNKARKRTAANMTERRFDQSEDAAFF